ncbi:MAG: hypothetical protein WC523_03820 [Patescibacteria group bacterium]
MIYGIKQYIIGDGQTFAAKSDQSTITFLDTNNPNYIDDDILYSVCKQTSKFPNAIIDICRKTNAKNFNTRLQYICGLYKVKEIFWRILPTQCGGWTLACGAFIIDGDFDYSKYEILDNTQ